MIRQQRLTSEENPLAALRLARDRFLHIEDPEQVWRARMLIDHLLERALGPEDSIALIERILAERE